MNESFAQTKLELVLRLYHIKGSCFAFLVPPSHNVAAGILSIKGSRGTFFSFLFFSFYLAEKNVSEIPWETLCSWSLFARWAGWAVWICTSGHHIEGAWWRRVGAIGPSWVCSGEKQGPHIHGFLGRCSQTTW